MPTGQRVLGTATRAWVGESYAVFVSVSDVDYEWNSFERRYYGDRLGYIEREFDLNSCHFVTMIRESPSM